MVSAFNAHARTQGYVVVKQRTKIRPKPEMVVKAYFCWDCERKPEKLRYEQKRKHSITCLIECFFSCFASYKQDTGVWKIVVCDLSHNHDPTIEDAHPALQKKAITAEILKTIKQ